MLSIKPIGGSDAQVSYYASLGAEDYYLSGTEPPGVWWGSGTRKLGLDDKVDGDSFANVLRGYAPDKTTKLVQNAGKKRRRAGYDLTFSDPKSVSICWSQADPETRKKINSARWEALHATLEQFVELCGFTRRGHNGSRIEKADLVGAIFQHETARAVAGHVPDVQLHFHVVICNAVCRADGTTGSFDSQALFTRHTKLALGALYRAELSARLQQIGFRSYRPLRENGNAASWFELDAVPPDLIREMSKRRAAVESWLLANGLQGAKAAEKAAVATRTAKAQLDRDVLHQSWQETCERFGFNRAQIEANRNADTREWPTEPPPNVVATAVARITESNSYFSRIELIRFAAEEAQGLSIGISEIVDAVDRHLADELAIVKLAADQFTSREMFELERTMLSTIDRLNHRNGHVVSATKVNDKVREFDTLRSEQAHAIEHLALEPGDIKCVNGLAGTGKTFMLRIAADVWDAEGYSVLGTSLAAQAAQVLETESGIESVHLARLFWELENGKRSLNASHVIVVDEAGMVGTKLLAQVVSLCEEKGAKLCLVGDVKQLQAIEAGGAFRSISKRIGCVEMKQISRQREVWARESVRELAEGDVHQALTSYFERGLLSIADDRDAAMTELVEHWNDCETSSLEERMIFAGTRAEVATLNRLCQRARLKAGQLRTESMTIGNDAFHVGDRVVFCKNNAALLVRNGNIGTVTEIDATNDRLRVQLDEGFAVTVATESYEHLRLAYAVTTHKGQGTTVENSFILAGGPMTDRELAYVQGSRARGTARIFTDVLSGGESIEVLAKSMSRSRQKKLAHDLMLEAK